MTREEILHQAADAIAREWLADEQRLAPAEPDAEDRWITASTTLARFYVHNLEQEERHRIVYDLAPAAMKRLRAERRSFSELVSS